MVEVPERGPQFATPMPREQAIMLAIVALLIAIVVMLTLVVVFTFKTYDTEHKVYCLAAQLDTGCPVK